MIQEKLLNSNGTDGCLTHVADIPRIWIDSAEFALLAGENKVPLPVCGGMIVKSRGTKRAFEFRSSAQFQVRRGVQNLRCRQRLATVGTVSLSATQPGNQSSLFLNAAWQKAINAIVKGSSVLAERLDLPVNTGGNMVVFPRKNRVSYWTMHPNMRRIEI